jgi:hypothetical protein
MELWPRPRRRRSGLRSSRRRSKRKRTKIGVRVGFQYSWDENVAKYVEISTV